MPNPLYSKEIQIEILDEIANNQGTTNNIEITDPVRAWNYHFLTDIGAIELLTTGSCDFNTPCGEKLLDVGKALRTELYEKIMYDRESAQKHQKLAQVQNGLWWMTLTILILTVILTLPIVVQILQFFLHHY